MKNIRKYLSVLMVALLLTSCEDFLDVNVDPNNPTEVTPNLVLPSAQKYTANLIHGTDAGARRINTLGNMMMYNWSQSDGFAWYPDEFKYLVTSSFYQGIFNDSYSSALKQYHILDMMEGSRYDYYKAIGKIMKAYHFQLLVDLYGDIPYTEALLRKDNATPKYDNQVEIYADLLVQLDAAIGLIKDAVAPVAVGDDDAMFGGDMEEWVRFANTVKLRILVRESGTRNVASDVAAIVAEGSGFITGDVMVNPGYLVEEGKQNPFWNFYGKDAGGTVTMTNNATCASDYVLAYLAGTNDPRIDFLYEKPANGHLGVPQGLLDYDTPVVDAFMPSEVSNIGPGLLKSATMGAVIFTLAESNFNQAEAVVSNLLTDGDAGELYKDGIMASMRYLGIEDTTAAKYFGKNLALIDWDSSPNKLQAIMTQKWIATNGLTAEQSWFDYTRTGYPSGLPKSILGTSADRPVRLYYPAGELSANGANVPVQPNAFTAKVFWGN